MTWQYRDHFSKDCSVEDRRKARVGDIWKNSIRCNHCNDVITSDNRHDFRYCKCGACAIDGGSWYTKVSCKNGKADFEDLVEMFDNV
jgi:hypothetical protein